MEYICLDYAFDIISLLSNLLLSPIFYWMKPRILVRAFKAFPKLTPACLFYHHVLPQNKPFPEHKKISYILFILFRSFLLPGMLLALVYLIPCTSQTHISHQSTHLEVFPDGIHYSHPYAFFIHYHSLVSFCLEL